MTSAEYRWPELDPIIHEAARLRIIAILNECESAEFTFLLAATELTRGNLSAHLAKLVGVGYVGEKKQFVERRPCSSYKLTMAGNQAYTNYLRTWRRITKARSV